MADAISFDESFWIEEIDPTDPESLSSVSVDYTPAFNLGTCFKDNFDAYLRYLSLLDPLEADALILYYFCDKKVKEIASIMKTTAVKVSTLIHQAESRLALLLHVNILLTDDVVQEIYSFVKHPQDQKIFFTFLREVSRRRVASQIGFTFHQVSATIRKIAESIELGNPSDELSDLISVLSNYIKPPRETRQLDHSERVSFFDVITCPQESTSSNLNPVYLLGAFENKGSHQAIREPFKPLEAPAAYYSANQAILAQQSSLPWSELTPAFVHRLCKPPKQALVFTVPLVKTVKSRSKKVSDKLSLTLTAMVSEAKIRE